MDINELESFKLSDAVKFHKELNPRLWQDEKLDPEVRDQLMLIAEDFVEYLGLDNLKVEDVTISGSNAAYSYTPHSDLDLHILVDFNKLPDNPVYQELFTAKKTLYNDAHDISVHGVPVELYVQDINQPVQSLGEYSIVHDKWIRIPKKRRANFDEAATKAKYEKLGDLIELALNTKDPKRVADTIALVKRYRKSGLDKHGEFGPENLAYKAVRKQGLVQALYDLKSELHGEKLSIEEAASREDALIKIKKLLQTAGRTPAEKENIKRIVAKMMQQWNIDPSEIGIRQKVDPVKAKIAKAAYEKTMAADLFKQEWNKFKQGIFAEGDDKTAAVLKIQKHLNKKYGANLDLDGKLGPLTLKSINKFMPKASKGLADEPNKTTAVQGKKLKEAPRTFQSQVTPLEKLIQDYGYFISTGTVHLEKNGETPEAQQKLLALVQRLQKDAKTFVGLDKSKMEANRDAILNHIHQMMQYAIPILKQYLPADKWEAKRGQINSVLTAYNNARQIKESIAYHVTPTRNLRSIMKDGLVPQIGNRSSQLAGENEGIFLFPSVDDVEAAVSSWLGDEFDEDEDLSLLAVDISGLENSIIHGADYETIINTRIDPKRISVSDELQLNEASGYIPSEKEKNDPRFKTALTVDVKPDAIKKNAKAFGFKTSRAGIPPQARADGKIAEDLMRKYKEFLGEQQEELFPGYDEQHREKRLGDWLQSTHAWDGHKPMVFYHATTKDFDTFNTHGTGFASALGMAFEVERHGSFFAVDPKFAESFIEDPNTGQFKEGGRVLPVYLSVQNPIDLRDNNLSYMLRDEETVEGFKANDIDLWSIYHHIGEYERWELFDGPEGADFVNNLQKLGFDGAIINEAVPNNSNARSGEVWVVFNPNQVKSIRNRGSFSPDDPRLMKESSEPKIDAHRVGDTIWINYFEVPVKGKGLGRAEYEKFEKSLPKDIKKIRLVASDAGYGPTHDFWDRMGFDYAYPDDDNEMVKILKRG